MEQEKPNDSAVSVPKTWQDYYQERVIDESQLHDGLFPDLSEWLGESFQGSVFELGCGASLISAKAALEGWQVNGIDYNADGLALLKNFLDSHQLDYGELFQADIFEFDWESIKGSADVIVSCGFLEHFTDPKAILGRAVKVLKPGGLVYSQIPNLYSINAKLMKKYDPDLWGQHVPYTIEAFDKFHCDAGLEPLVKAKYEGGYDEQMLIPWGEIRESHSLLMFKLAKYFSSFVLSPLMKLLPHENARTYNPNIIGVYRKL